MSKKQYKTILTTVIQKLRDIPEKTTNILCEVKQGRMNITFNRPKRLNSFSLDMYIYLTELIQKANQIEEIRYIVIQGASGNFSTGNDLANFTNPLLLQVGQIKDIVKSISEILKKLCQEMIKSKKPIFAITQGKVIGFAFTQLALFDRVYSVQNSQFVAPLVRIAQGPQMCSSYLFPKIFGFRQAERLIALGETVNVQYLSKYNFCQSCKSRGQAQKKLQDHLKDLDTLEWKSYLNSRRLMKEPQIKNLLQANEKQITNLVQRWMDPQLLENINKHLQKAKQSSKPKPKL